MELGNLVHTRSQDLGAHILPFEKSILIGQIVADKSVEYAVPAELILAVIETESAYGGQEKSVVGARGIMQILPRYARTHADTAGLKSFNIVNLSDNISMGTAHLAQLRDWYRGDWGKALTAYNRGVGGFRASGYKISGYAKLTLRKARKLGAILSGNPYRCRSPFWVRGIT